MYGIYDAICLCTLYLLLVVPFYMPTLSAMPNKNGAEEEDDNLVVFYYLSVFEIWTERW